MIAFGARILLGLALPLSVVFVLYGRMYGIEVFFNCIKQSFEEVNLPWTKDFLQQAIRELV
jgi:hypothetical protein